MSTTQESLAELEKWHTHAAATTHTMNVHRRDMHLEFAAAARMARAALSPAVGAQPLPAQQEPDELAEEVDRLANNLANYLWNRTLSNHDQAPRMREELREAIGRLASRSMVDTGALQERSDAWDAVVSVLHDVMPGWSILSHTGMSAACAAIRLLSTPPAPSEPAQPVPARYVGALRDVADAVCKQFAAAGIDPVIGSPNPAEDLHARAVLALGGTLKREHVASAACWCGPSVEHRDPDSGAEVFVHKELQ